MPRNKSIVWKHVERLEGNNKNKCKFCQHEFSGGATRITEHLAGKKGNVTICSKVPQHVKDSVLEEISCLDPDVKKRRLEEISRHNKIRKIAHASPSSINVEENNVEENRAILSQPVLEGAHIPRAFSNGSFQSADYDFLEGLINCPSSNGDVLPTTIPTGQTADRNMESEGHSLESVGAMLESFPREGCPLDVEQTSESFPRAGCPLDGEQVTHPNSHSSNGDELSTTTLAGRTTDVRNMEEDTSLGTSNAIIAVPESIGCHSSNEDALPTTEVAGQTTDIGNPNPLPTGDDIIAMTAFPRSVGNSPVGEQVTHHNSHSNNGEALQTLALAGQTTDVRGYPLLTTKLVGQASQRTVDKIWKIVMKDDVLSIGIHGMGGVGKTALVMHTHNRLLQNLFNVCWVTVSQDFSIKKLQNDIAKVIKLDLSDEDDEKKRAAKLACALRRKEKLLVLILDDVWKYFSLQEVGIPVEVNVCKLILTTRFLDVCQRMCCQEIVKVEPLNKKEAWNLFMEKFRHDIPLEVRDIAWSIAKECAGLPLGIITVAGSMKGMDIDIHGWRNALEELEHSKAGNDMEDGVFRVLKFSYNSLKDPILQQCFLYCSLYPEDFKIERVKLIELLIDEGVIERKQTRQAEFDKGHAMLNNLENAYLLERVADMNGNKCVKMHDLVRDMAIQIAQSEHNFMVEAGKELEDLPDKEKWKKDLVRVSLMYNGLTKIPSNALPRCPKLSTLMLNNNKYLETIPYSFFLHMPRLKVLNLSYTNIEYLPDSVFNLKNLTALVLIGCKKLKHVNSLEKLTKLRRLELVHTGIKEIPQGLEMLVNLRHLNVYSETLEIFPSGILLKLSQLQHFEFDLSHRLPFEFCLNLNLEVEEAASLKKLEYFKCQFNDVHAFKTCVNFLKNVSPTNYVLQLGSGRSRIEDGSIEGKVVILKDRSIIRDKKSLLLPEDADFLKLCNINFLRSLCYLPSLSILIGLKKLCISDCEGILSLFDVPLSYDPHIFPLLASTHYYHIASLLPSGTFSQLKVLIVSDCNRIEELFPHWLVQNLYNLKEIRVSSCSKLVEIIGALSNKVEEDTTISSLPKSRLLELGFLLKLLSICPKLNLDERVASSPVPPAPYFQLQILELSCCESIKKVFTHGLLLHLHNLEEIRVSWCKNLVEIIGARNKEEAIHISLLNLRVLKLWNLPELKSICSSSSQLMVCDSIQEIEIFGCPKLKRFPLSLPLLNGQPCPPPSLYKIKAEKKWWESLEWDHPNSKTVLQSIFEGSVQ